MEQYPYYVLKISQVNVYHLRDKTDVYMFCPVLKKYKRKTVIIDPNYTQYTVLARFLDEFDVGVHLIGMLKKFLQFTSVSRDRGD